MKQVTKLLSRTLGLGYNISKFVKYRCYHTPLSSKVFISSSRSIFQNLAFEDWLYENADLENEMYLFLWRDEPCVVIGRHQNPWLECNVPYCEKHDVKVARRKSGGEKLQ